MMMALGRYALLILVLAQVSVQEDVFDLSDTTLPHQDFIATGYVPRRGLKQASLTLGIGSGFTYNVRAGSDALPVFNRAIAALKAAGGGTLTVGKGTFILGGPLVWTASKSALVGAGMGLTILKLKDKAPTFKSAGFLRAIGVNDVTVSDITLDGNKGKQVNKDKEAYGRYGIFMANYKNWKFQRVEVQNFQRYGFDPHGIKKSTNPNSKANVWSFGLTVLDCLSHDNNWDGYTFDQTYNVYAARNKSYKNGRYGFNIVTASRNVFIEKNEATDNGFGAKTPTYLFDGGDGCGYVADTNKPGFDTYNVTFQDNIATNSFRAGFCVKDSGRITINRNNITKGGACANWKRLRANVRFTNNKCTGTTKQFTISGTLGTAPFLSGNTFA